MTPNDIAPSDRAAFDDALASIHSDHAVLRKLAIAASQRGPFTADDTMTLAEAVMAHENTESRLFELPFVSRPPESVISTAARARLRCVEYTSGSFRLPDPEAAAALFVDALLTHLAVEDAWLAHEAEHQQDRLRTIG